MPRNLNRRVELLFPVEDSGLKRRLISILELMLADNQNARYQDKNRRYRPVTDGDKPVNSQLELARRAHAASVRKRRSIDKAQDKEKTETDQ